MEEEAGKDVVFSSSSSSSFQQQLLHTLSQLSARLSETRSVVTRSEDRLSALQRDFQQLREETLSATAKWGFDEREEREDAKPHKKKTLATATTTLTTKKKKKKNNGCNEANVAVETDQTTATATTGSTCDRVDEQQSLEEQQNKRKKQAETKEKEKEKEKNASRRNSRINSNKLTIVVPSSSAEATATTTSSLAASPSSSSSLLPSPTLPPSSSPTFLQLPSSFASSPSSSSSSLDLSGRFDDVERLIKAQTDLMTKQLLIFLKVVEERLVPSSSASSSASASASEREKEEMKWRMVVMEQQMKEAKSKMMEALMENARKTELLFNKEQYIKMLERALHNSEEEGKDEEKEKEREKMAMMWQRRNKQSRPGTVVLAEQLQRQLAEWHQQMAIEAAEQQHGTGVEEQNEEESDETDSAVFNKRENQGSSSSATGSMNSFERYLYQQELLSSGKDLGVVLASCAYPTSSSTSSPFSDSTSPSSSSASLSSSATKRKHSRDDERKTSTKRNNNFSSHNNSNNKPELKLVTTLRKKKEPSSKSEIIKNNDKQEETTPAQSKSMIVTPRRRRKSSSCGSFDMIIRQDWSDPTLAAKEEAENAKQEEEEKKRKTKQQLSSLVEAPSATYLGIRPPNERDVISLLPCSRGSFAENNNKGQRHEEGEEQEEDENKYQTWSSSAARRQLRGRSGSFGETLPKGGDRASSPLPSQSLLLSHPLLDSLVRVSSSSSSSAQDDSVLEELRNSQRRSGRGLSLASVSELRDGCAVNVISRDDMMVKDRKRSKTNTRSGCNSLSIPETCSSFASSVNAGTKLLILPNKIREWTAIHPRKDKEKDKEREKVKAMKEEEASRKRTDQFILEQQQRKKNENMKAFALLGVDPSASKLSRVLGISAQDVDKELEQPSASSGSASSLSVPSSSPTSAPKGRASK